MVNAAPRYAVGWPRREVLRALVIVDVYRGNAARRLAIAAALDQRPFVASGQHMTAKFAADTGETNQCEDSLRKAVKLGLNAAQTDQANKILALLPIATR
jgi:hypothetical protein